MLCLRFTAMLAAITGYCFANEEDLVFEYEPLDVQIFEGVNETVSFKCNATSKIISSVPETNLCNNLQLFCSYQASSFDSNHSSTPCNDLIYYRWYFRPPNGTFVPLEKGDSNELTVTKPSKANHGYYLCQAYNYMGSVESRVAELYVLRTSTIQLSIMADFSIDWFELEAENIGSGNQRINVTDSNVIQVALEAVLNSTNITEFTVKLGTVTNRPGGSEVEAEILSVCDDCNLLNNSLDTVKNEVMSLYSKFTNVVEHINVGINDNDFTIVSSNSSVIRMEIVMATAGNVSMECPQTMSISDEHFFVCVNCGPGHYVRGSTCVPCGLDQFQDKQGQTSCRQCPAGSFIDDIGATSVEECIAGESSRITEDDGDGGVIAGVVVPVVFVIMVVVTVIIYTVYKGYRRKKDNSTAPPTIVIQNPVVVPIPIKLDDNDADDEDNLSDIPTIRYEKPPTAPQSVKKSSKVRKNHKSEKVIRRSQEVYKWNRSYSVAQVKNKYPNGSQIPSFYPIGEYVGSLSDNEEEYDHIVSPSGTARRRSMSISDLTSVLKDYPSYSLQVPPNLRGNVLARHDDLHRLNSKPKSSPPAMEMDDEMSDLYDATLRRDRSNTVPSHKHSDVRLSGMMFSLNGHCNSESVPKITKRESSNSVSSARPVTQYVNNEIVEKHRDSMDSSAADVASQVQFQGQERVIQFEEMHEEEEPKYVTMRPVKLSLPNLGNYFTEHKRSQMTKPLSLHDNPVDIGPAIELANVKKRSRRDSVDIDSVVSDSEA